MKWLTYAVSGLGFALAMFVSTSVHAADDYKGADALLTEIYSAEHSPAGTAAPLTPARQWLEDMETYRRSSGKLSPDETAGRWLALATRYFSLGAAEIGSLPPDDQARLAQDLGGPGFQDPLLKSLPGPAAWPCLARLIDARPAQTDPQKKAVDNSRDLSGIDHDEGGVLPCPRRR